MRIQEQPKNRTGCKLSGQASCKCCEACAKNASTPSSNLYAAEFMLYAFHFARELEAPVNHIKKSKRANRQ